MAHRIVVAGGGTGGTIAANRLRRALPREEAEIVVVDRDDGHVYQPGLLFVPFGLANGEIVRPRHQQFLDGVRFREALVDRIETAAQDVHLADGEIIPYDVLVVATGAALAPEDTPGLTGPGWMETVFTFYTPQGAQALHEALCTFRSGHLVVGIVDLPIKSPTAPLEFCFLADWYFHHHGRREDVQITFVTPLGEAFDFETASRQFDLLLADKGIDLVSDFTVGSVDGTGGRLESIDGREVDFDLAVVVPTHTGAACILRSPGLGDALGFVDADPHTLQAKAAPNVFVIGDAAGVPTAKAGSVSHFEGNVLVENVRRFLAGQPLDASYDGHANGYVETGFHKAILLDYDYDTEPLPGRYPGTLGLPLLEESRRNHLAKLLYQPLYWHAFLPGRDLPGLGSIMPTRGGHDDSVGTPGPQPAPRSGRHLSARGGGGTGQPDDAAR